MCHESFDPFFHDSNPSGPLINSLNYFRICIRFRRDIRAQSDLRGYKIEFFTCLWLLLKRQSGEILLGVNTSIIKEKNWSIKFWFIENIVFFISAVCCTPRKLNSKILQPFYQRPKWGWIMKKWRSKISWHIPFKHVFYI